MEILGKNGGCGLAYCGLAVIIFCGLCSSPGLSADYQSRLAAGEIITYSGDVPDSAAKKRGGRRRGGHASGQGLGGGHRRQ